MTVRQKTVLGNKDVDNINVFDNMNQNLNIRKSVGTDSSDGLSNTRRSDDDCTDTGYLCANERGHTSYCQRWHANSVCDGSGSCLSPSGCLSSSDSSSSCTSSTSWRDSDGDGCSYYERNQDICGYEDSERECCVCGGGSGGVDASSGDNCNESEFSECVGLGST